VQPCVQLRSCNNRCCTHNLIKLCSCHSLLRSPDLNKPSHGGRSALHHACLKPHPAAVLELLINGVDANVQDNSGATPLHYLCTAASSKFGAQDARRSARLLLRVSAKTDNTTACGDTPLHTAAAAASARSSGLVPTLLRAGCDVNAASASGATPLHAAAGAGAVTVMRLLLQAGAAVDAQDAQGWTPLCTAAAASHVDAVQLLLQHGAMQSSSTVAAATLTRCPEIKQQLQTARLALSPVYSTSTCGSVPDEAFLSQQTRTADSSCFSRRVHTTTSSIQTITAAADLEGKSQLHWAAFRGDAALVAALLAAHTGGKSGSITSRDHRRRTPLHSACLGGQQQCVVLLLRAGSDVAAVCSQQQTVLHYAVRSGSLQVLTTLLSWPGCSTQLINAANRYIHCDICTMYCESSASCSALVSVMNTIERVAGCTSFFD
jgi:ankyrin repeat protein